MMKFLCSLCLSLIAASAFCNNYYVSNTGNDANSGLSPTDAWASIAQVNAAVFAAGDSLLFEGGGLFTGSVDNQSLSNGVTGNRITISSYGSGKATISTSEVAGIYLLNPGGLAITRLVVQGNGITSDSFNIYRHGIDISLDSFATRNSEDIILDSLECKGYGGWGILLTTESKNYGFKDLRVTNSLLHDNGIGGFCLYTYYDLNTYTLTFNHQNVYLGNIIAYNNPGRLDYVDNWSGSGILIAGTTNGLVEYCESYGNGKYNGSPYAGPVGIFLGDSKFITIQYCSSHHNLGGPGKRDGGGFDLDQGAYGCVIQYCTSYENEGAGYGLYQAPSEHPWSNDTIRFNTSTNDGRNFGVYSAITFWGVNSVYKVTNAQVYGNQINMNKPGYALGFLNNNQTNNQVYDNTFCLEAPASYLNYALDAPIPSGAIVYNSTFTCSVKEQYPFIKPVTYRGAFAPAPTGMWTSTWTNYDPQNVAYGVADSVIETPITTSITLSGLKRYLLKGIVYVTNGARLTIQPGCLIRADQSIRTALVITRGARIHAVGLASKPIVFTSNRSIGTRAPGDWGGIVLLGKAGYNGAGGESYIEGLNPQSETQFGGGASPIYTDSSGTMQFIRIEFAGNSSPGMKMNGLTFGAVGRGTTINNIQVSYSGDDAFEWFGGSVNCRNLVAYRSKDDDWDATNGYHGAVQFALGLRDPALADDISSDGLESDNDEAGSESVGFTSAIFCNVTEIGPLRGNQSATIATAYKRSVQFTNNSHVRMLNSILMDYPVGVGIEGNSTADLATGNYIATAPNKSPGNLVFKNNLVAGNLTGQLLETNTGLDMSNWFKSNKNDSSETTTSILVNPYLTTGSNVFAGDYRPAVSSVALSNYNWSDSAYFDIDSTSGRKNLINCPPLLAVPIIAGPVNPYTYTVSGDTARYYISSRSILGVLQTVWAVPAGVSIQSGQGTDTLVVTFANTFAGGNITAQNLSYCGVLSGTKAYAIKSIAPAIYTFIGDGNWDVAGNWSNNVIPPASLPSGSEIIISPALNGSCILNVPQTVLPGGKLTVQQDKIFIIQGNLTVK